MATETAHRPHTAEPRSGSNLGHKRSQVIALTRRIASHPTTAVVAWRADLLRRLQKGCPHREVGVVAGSRGPTTGVCWCCGAAVEGVEGGYPSSLAVLINLRNLDMVMVGTALEARL